MTSWLPLSLMTTQPQTETNQLIALQTGFASEILALHHWKVKLHCTRKELRTCNSRTWAMWNRTETNITRHLTQRHNSIRPTYLSHSIALALWINIFIYHSLLHDSNNMRKIKQHIKIQTRRALHGAHIPPTKVFQRLSEQEVKVIWQKAPIPRLWVIQGGRKLYHWIPGVGFPISVP